MSARAASQAPLDGKTAGRAVATPRSCLCGCGRHLYRQGQKYGSAHCRNRHWRALHPRTGTSEEQLALEIAAPEAEAPPEPDAKPTIQERFEAWVEENPEIYRLIRKYAYEYLEAWLQWEDGRRRKVGIDLIVGRVRYEHNKTTRGAEPWAVNNDFRSRIPRRLIQEDRRFADLFELRALKAD